MAEVEWGKGSPLLREAAEALDGMDQRVRVVERPELTGLLVVWFEGDAAGIRARLEAAGFEHDCDGPSNLFKPTPPFKGAKAMTFKKWEREAG